MAAKVTALRVLIASPSDTVDARGALVRAIGEWNDLNFEGYGVVLVPTLWEISASPEMGSAPQAIINRQMGDGADIVVGVFWTRLGSPTDDAESGTVEEIERAAKRGAEVLLYFSNQPVVPATVDPEQLKALSDFKESVKDRSLFGDYESVPELAHTVQRDLTRAVKRMAEAGKLDEVSSPTDTGSTGQPKARTVASEIRRIVAEGEAMLAAAVADDDADEIRRLMAAIASRLVDILGEIAANDVELTDPGYQWLLQLSQRASQLSRFRVYLDGGKSWRELIEGAEALLKDLRNPPHDDD